MSKVAVMVVLIIIILFLIYVWSQRNNNNNNSNNNNNNNNFHPELARSVDLQKYAGTWYEIARLPTPYEDFGSSRCVNATAEYTLNSNNTMTVVNKCQVGVPGQQGYMIQANGIAVPNRNTIVNGTTVSPASLLVKFDSVPAWGEYNILYLDPAYSYAMVGTSDRNSLWILSRTNTIDPQVYNYLITIAGKLNYPVQNLVFS